MKLYQLRKSLFALTLTLLGLCISSTVVFAQQQTNSGSVGIQGTVSAPPPTGAPIISLPTPGQTFTSLPVTVSGICSESLLVKLFKNGVFSGSSQCANGSFTLQIDLFGGTNELIAKQYDLLDQESPPSGPVSVTYNESSPGQTVTERVTLSSNFAKRGADPREKLTWPIVVSGGTGPYAVTVEWGDGEQSLQSVPTPGEFTIEHTYANPGVYNVIVKAVDVNGKTAYIQLVAIGNGTSAQSGSDDGTTLTTGGKTPSANTTQIKTKILWQPAAIMIPFIVSTFWLGKRYAVYRIRKKIEAGERPFSY